MTIKETENLEQLTPSMLLGYINERISIEVERHIKFKLNIPTNDGNETKTSDTPVLNGNFDLNSIIGRISNQGHGVEYIRSYLYRNYALELPDSRIIPFHERIKKEYEDWSKKPLNKVYPILWIDSVNFRMQENGRIVTKELFYCFGLDVHGSKHTVAIATGNRKGQTFRALLENISKRGIKDVLMLCVADLAQIKKLAKDYFPKAYIQSYIFSQVNRSVEVIPYKYKIEFKKSLSSIYKANSKEEAVEMFKALEKKWGSLLPKECKKWKEYLENYNDFWELPSIFKDLFYAPNVSQSINKKMKLVVESMVSENHLKLIFFRYQQDICNRTSQRKMRNWNAILLALDKMFPDRIQG